jgi:hypothetical protein
MPFEPMLFANASSQLAAAVATLLLALKLKKEKRCSLQNPFYILSVLLLALSLVNFLWSFGIISITSADNSYTIPIFNLSVIAVWLYTAIRMLGYKQIYYAYPLIITIASAVLILYRQAFASDLLLGFAVIAVFMSILLRKQSLGLREGLEGIAFGLSFMLASAAAFFYKLDYARTFWAIPYAAFFLVMLFALHEKKLCSYCREHQRHPVPLIVRVLKFGFFVVGLSVLLMLGILGVHELGHSIVANLYGCEHETTFGIGYAKTHVQCESDSGTVLIKLGGLSLTLLVSLSFLFMGNDFARKISSLLFAFSMLISAEDVTSLDLPYSIVMILFFVAATLTAYGMYLLVTDYELESRYSGSACDDFSKESYLNTAGRIDR